MTDDEIFARHAREAARRGHEPLFGGAAALRVVDDAVRHGLGVAGLDGFTLVGSGFRLDLGAIADFSGAEVGAWTELCERSGGWARRFLDEMGDRPDLVFSVTLLSEEEWRR